MNIALVTEKKTLRLFEWLLSWIGYGLILIMMSVLFKNTMQIDTSWYGVWAFIAAFLLTILNQTIKPILVKLTLPITALSLGIFYPCINLFLLQIVNIALGKHFEINGFFMAFFLAILISLMKIATQKLLIDPILEKE